MDDVRFGVRIRALRRRRGWRQVDLAGVCGLGQSTVSLVERGHLDALSLRAVRAILAALDATLDLDVRWRGGTLDRLLDEDHARIVGLLASTLIELGWIVRTEVTYSQFGERGSVDLLAYHEATRSLLVIEVKTEIASAEATVRKLDEKVRLAPGIARERFGWAVGSVSAALALPESSTVRRQIARHRALFDAAVPTDGRTLRAWLAHPKGAVRGRMFLSGIDARGGIRGAGGRQRVRSRSTHRVSDGSDA